jgi:3-phosphoinositide dependent protein kinase-1
LYQVYLECEILQSLDHPNIVKLNSVFEETDKIFMVLEYLENGDFYEFMKNNCRSFLILVPLKFETIQFFTAQLVNVFEYLKINNIIHRDVKVNSF